MISVSLEDKPLALDKDSLDKLAENINNDLKEVSLLLSHSLEDISTEGAVDKLRSIFTKACDVIIGLIKKIGSFIYKQFRVILADIKGGTALDTNKLLDFKGQFKVYNTVIPFNQICNTLDVIYQKLFDYTKEVEGIIVDIITSTGGTDPIQSYDEMIGRIKQDLNVDNISDVVSQSIFGCSFSEISTKYKQVSLIEYLQTTCEYRDSAFPKNPTSGKLFGKIETYDAVGKWSSQFAKANTRLKKYYDVFRQNNREEIKQKGLAFMDSCVLSWLNDALIGNSKDLNRLPEYLLNHVKYYDIVVQECKL